MKNDYSMPRDLYYSIEVDADALIKAKAEAYTRVVELRAHRDDKTIYKQDRLRVEYFPPDSGWLQTKIYINGEQVLDFHFSDHSSGGGMDVVERTRTFYILPHLWKPRYQMRPSPHLNLHIQRLTADSNCCS